MFSVPGWNVSAPLKKQVETAPAKEAPQGRKSAKRQQKRQQKEQMQVDERNLGELWEKVVEKGDKGIGMMGSGSNSQPLGEKTGRKRKRGKGGREGGEEDVGDEKLKAEEVVQEKEEQKEEGDDEAAAKRERKKRKKENKAKAKAAKADVGTAVPSVAATLPPLIPEPPNLTPLQKSMRAKLTSARFRHLNESLYTKPSKESLEIFKENPDMFEDYHRGFAQQVEVWPENPVDGYVDAILSRGGVRVKDPWKDKKRQEKGKKKGAEQPSQPPQDASSTPIKPLPRNMRGHATIADLGCGTASLSYRLQPSLKNLNLTLHSFDLSKPTGPTANLVTIADIANLPLADNSVDVAIFCLALMGTNWLDFIDEAYRVLRWRGELWISEIKSRFGRVGRSRVPINSVGSLRKPEKAVKGGKKKAKDAADEKEGPQDSADEAELATTVDGAAKSEGTDVSAFVNVLKAHGFVLDALPERQMDAVDLSNKMFVKLQFVKGAQPTKGKNVDAAREREKSRGGGGLKMGMQGKKFAAVGGEEEEDEGQDGKVLKPCLYKTR
ncbi:hypothetical protein M011DRAFT_441261 [Sporormia fimetaria CBS 119925]|uniref:Ribosomal RNA-processing protein 8 n=1 Tax=Sporormia fimetaria CBS 119925 TaxID=1340428 RepID=A0A6A6VGC9_9PLEO|nr:hypothetical protein M011DRAFT_441261 [Sporormia fimetaria CBS 119925]